MIAEFNAKHPGIQIQGLSVPDQEKQIAAMSAGNAAFDLSDTFNTELAAYASKGVIAPLNKYLKQSNYSTSDFVPAAIASCRYNGKTYAPPIGVFTDLLLYN